MSSDIERLHTELAEERQWRQELADLSVDQQREIERLKVEVDETNSQITTLEWQLSEATKEIERLRAALTEIAETPWLSGVPSIAREALRQS